MTYCAIRPGPYDAGAYITESNNLRTLMRATTRAVGQSGEAMIYKTEDLSVVMFHRPAHKSTAQRMEYSLSLSNTRILAG